MTDTPPNTAISDDTSPFPPRRRYRREWAVWIMLVVVSTLFIVLQTLGVRALHKREAIHAEAGSSVPLQLLGEYAVGMKLMHPAGPAAATPAQLLSTLDQMAQNTIEAIRVVPIIAELQGARSALARIAELEKNGSLDAADRQDLAVLRTLYDGHPTALSAAQKQRLVARHGWFARLALSYGLPRSDPLRHAILAGTRRALLASAAAGVGGMVLLGVGGILLLAGLVFALTGRLKSAFQRDNRRDPAATQPLLETVVLFLLMLVAMDLAELGLRRWTGRDWMPVIAWLAALVLLWPRARGLRWPEVRRHLGWHAGRGVAREIGAGLLGYLAGMPLLALGAWATTTLAGREHQIPIHPVVEQIARAGPWHTFGIFLLLCLWAPLMEESIFRGALFSHLRQRWAALWSALFSGLLFAGLHPQGWIALPLLLAIGFTFAMIREWRGSILPSATAHALNNGLVFLLMVSMLQP